MTARVSHMLTSCSRMLRGTRLSCVCWFALYVRYGVHRPPARHLPIISVQFSGWAVFLKDNWNTATFVTNYLVGARPAKVDSPMLPLFSFALHLIPLPLHCILFLLQTSTAQGIGNGLRDWHQGNRS